MEHNSCRPLLRYSHLSPHLKTATFFSFTYHFLHLLPLPLRCFSHHFRLLKKHLRPLQVKTDLRHFTVSIFELWLECKSTSRRMPLTRALPQKLIQIKSKNRRAGPFWCCGSDGHVWCVGLAGVKLHSCWKLHLLTPNCCGSSVAGTELLNKHVILTRTWQQNRQTDPWYVAACCTCCHTYQHNSLPLFMAFALNLGHWVHTMQRMSHHLIPPSLKGV